MQILEKKIEENREPLLLKSHDSKKVPKWNRDAFTDKVRFESILIYPCCPLVNTTPFLKMRNKEKVKRG